MDASRAKGRCQPAVTSSGLAGAECQQLGSAPPLAAGLRCQRALARAPQSPSQLPGGLSALGGCEHPTPDRRHSSRPRQDDLLETTLSRAKPPTKPEGHRARKSLKGSVANWAEGSGSRDAAPSTLLGCAACLDARCQTAILASSLQAGTVTSAAVQQFHRVVPAQLQRAVPSLKSRPVVSTSCGSLHAERRGERREDGPEKGAGKQRLPGTASLWVG